MSQHEAFEREGAALFPQALNPSELQRLHGFAGDRKKAGERLDVEALAPIADLINHNGSIGQIASSLSNRLRFAVRAILFDKVQGQNWSLHWHQDRTINVAERLDVAGYGPWTTKQAMVHVQPPQSVIDAMITLRVHLDDVPAGNGELRVLPGSHRLGRLPEGEIRDLALRVAPIDCLAARGDIWAYRTAIVHASGPAAPENTGRRVLQLDYACDSLSTPLRWAMAI